MDSIYDSCDISGYEDIRKRITGYIKENLSEKRLKHTFAVEKEAASLAEHYGADVDKARLAALFHDMCRNYSEKASDMFIRHLGLPAKYEGNRNLAHGKIAAQLMRRDYGITDEDLLNAVSFHTTGRAGMSLLEKIVFLADAIEPARDYPGVDELRRLAYEDLDKACIRSLEGTIGYIESRGGYLDPDTINARDYLKEKTDL